MKRTLLRCAALTLLLVIVAPLRAAEKYDPAALAAAVAPYLDDATLCVAHVDLARVDLAPAVARIKEMVPHIGTPKQQAAAFAEMDKGVEAARKWLADFNATGAHDCFAIVSMSDFTEFPVYLVVPLPAGANGQAIAKLLSAGDPAHVAATEVRQNVVLWGRKAALDRLAAMKTPSPRPELASAFEAAGDTAAQLIFIPSDDARKVLIELAPNPTAGPFAGAGEVVTKGIVWGALGINLTPNLSFSITLQSPDADAAKSLADLTSRAVAMGKMMLARAIRTTPEGARLAGDLDALAKAFTPTVTGARLTFGLDADQSLKLTAVVLPAVAKAREQATQMRAMSNLRQILLGCINYANEHKNQYPPDLQVLNGDLPPEVLRNPRNPEKEVGFTYLPPIRGVGTPAEQVIAYEAYDAQPDNIAVGFADGHVELMSFSRFEQALAQSKARNAAP